jgi:hypothetical protein
MSKIKEQYHEEINAGLHSQPSLEPYIFKYMAYFKYNGQVHTILADSLDKILELASGFVTGCEALEPCYEGTINEYKLVCEYWSIPILIFETGITHY